MDYVLAASVWNSQHRQNQTQIPNPRLCRVIWRLCRDVWRRSDQ